MPLEILSLSDGKESNVDENPVLYSPSLMNSASGNTINMSTPLFSNPNQLDNPIRQNEYLAYFGIQVADGDDDDDRSEESLDRELIAMSDRSYEQLDEGQKENVDQMKIQTMYNMVNDCKVSVGGRDTMKKVLYLTNKQASLFDDMAMERCLQALDIGDPKFIILLSTSFGVRKSNVESSRRSLRIPIC